MATPSYDRDIEFIYEMGALRFIKRSWHRFLGPDFANNTEHHFRVAMIALIIYRREQAAQPDVTINLEKILFMALIHDIPESRTGDVDYISRQYVKRDDHRAIEDMLEGTVIAGEVIELWKEYERRDCLEAKIVKDADNLDVDFELAEQAAAGYASLFQSKANMRARVAATKLYTDTARQIWEELQGTNPHDWHHNSSGNRFNSGDWKDAKESGSAGHPHA